MKRSLLILLLISSMLLSIVACNPKLEEAKKTAEPTLVVTLAPTAKPSPTPKPEGGTNVALNKPVEVSTGEEDRYRSSGWAADYINDGRIEFEKGVHAGWTSLTKQYFEIEDFEEMWIEIDLLGVIEIDKIALWPRQDNGNSFPEDYHIVVSTDRKEETRVIEITGDERSLEENREANMPPAILSFEPIEARYVTLVVTKPTPSVGAEGLLVQLAEFAIYAAPSSDE